MLGNGAVRAAYVCSVGSCLVLEQEEKLTLGQLGSCIAVHVRSEEVQSQDNRNGNSKK